METKPRVAIILMNRDRPDITDKVFEQVRTMGEGLETKIFVVECGSKPESRSQYATHYFKDKNYKGRYYGFNQGLKFADAEGGPWDYYWFLVNDIYFDEGADVLRELYECMLEDERMALIGPGEPEGADYRGCFPKPEERRWHKASTVHGLAWLMRGQAIREVGYCNPIFHYAQGSSTELAYKLYKEGWFLAYADRAVLYHEQSGSTYGVVTKISRHEYHRRARKFASKYLRKHYGENWDEVFAGVLPPDVEENTFPWQKEVWEKELKKERGLVWFWKVGSFVKQRLKRILGHA